jgi:hypothetical protein
MFRLVLFSFLLLFPFSVPAQDEGGELVEEFRFNADSTDPPEIRDGDQYPYKYLSEFTMRDSGTVKLYFYAANNSYQYDSINSQPTIFTLPKRTGSVKIYKEGSGTVKFNGKFNGADYKSGIDIQSSNVTIEDGIYFTNFWHNPVYIHGSDSNHLSNITIKNCVIDSTRYRDGSTTRNCASIRSAHAENVLITNCVIRQPNQNAQVDGIFADSTFNLEIRNNTIVLENNEHFFQHLDCMQITNDCSNVTIENNYIENASTQIDPNRQGIYITETTGDIKIINNILVSRRGRGIINIQYYDKLQKLQILNNTIVGYSNPQHQVLIDWENGIGADIMNIMNNILFKDGTADTIYKQALVFYNLDFEDLTPEKLNTNLYWNTNGVKPTIQCGTSRDFDLVEENPVWGNPLFLSDYSVQNHSPAKNKGTGLFSHVTKDKFGNSRPYWNYDFDIGAYEIEDTQLKIGVTGVADTQNIIHNLTLFDTYWERHSSGNWIKSTDQELTSASFTTEGNITDIDSLEGFQYKWLDRYPYITSTRIGTGLYKITNDYNNNSNYIYVDLRDAVQDYSLNVYIQYDALNGKYYYWQNDVWKELPNGSVIGIWELPGGSVTTHTSQLDAQFWRYCLVDLEKENHPFLVWAPYTQSGTTSYTLYRKNGASFTAVTPGYTWRHYDSTLSIVQPGGYAGHTVKYYVSAQSSNTDTVNYEITGAHPDKIAGSYSPQFTYSLSQNYPNPFNPSTVIEFSVAEEGLVSIRLYDILGREVSSLLNTEMEPGIHKQSFNLGTLASGIYFYRITAGKYTDSKKLQVLK